MLSIFNIPHILCKIYSTNIFTYIVYITSTVDTVHVVYTIYILSKSTYTIYIYIYVQYIYNISNIYIINIYIMHIFYLYLTYYIYMFINIYIYTPHIPPATIGLAAEKTPPSPATGGGDHLAGGGCGGSLLIYNICQIYACSDPGGCDQKIHKLPVSSDGKAG